jgi:hypothetical protein
MVGQLGFGLDGIEWERLTNGVERGPVPGCGSDYGKRTVEVATG